VVTEKYAHLYTEDLHVAKRKADTKVDTTSVFRPVTVGG